MIQPIRCFTCGRVIADQIDYYNKEKMKQIEKYKKEETKKYEHFEGNHTGELLDKLGASRYCCRRMYISDVDMMDII
jgi:DNA-directed RNA polymerase subunit N (RpoN/RPB10)|tara:strand:- start:904 stop:1134 length:231 start_codon:yes stop_codon:yes gene_type:complete